MLLNGKGERRLQLFLAFNGQGYDVRLSRSIRRVDAYLSPCTREESGLGRVLEPVLTDKNLVGSTSFETVNGITVLNVLRLFFGQLHTLAFIETYF